MTEMKAEMTAQMPDMYTLWSRSTSERIETIENENKAFPISHKSRAIASDVITGSKRSQLQALMRGVALPCLQ